MSTPIDEGAAWSLLRAVPIGVPSRPLRVHHHAHPEVWLQVHPTGAWSTSTETTDGAGVLLDLFLPIQCHTDLVIAQSGQSLDGRIATTSGHSHYVTGAADIRRLHRLRALVDAVVVGAGTVDADNPRLTVRDVDGHNPVRIILDPGCRLDRNRHVFTDGAAPTVVVRSEVTGQNRGRVASGARDEIQLPTTNHQFAPSAIVNALRERGYRRILVEGGGRTVSGFLQAGMLDRLHVTVSPMIIGSGPPAVTLEPIASLDDALRPACRSFRLGEDTLFDLDLRHSRASAPPVIRSSKRRRPTTP